MTELPAFKTANIFRNRFRHAHEDYVGDQTRAEAGVDFGRDIF